MAICDSGNRRVRAIPWTVHPHVQRRKEHMRPTIPLFECEYLCLCKNMITWAGPSALVYSQTGARIHCRSCGRLWAIIPTGAQLLETAEARVEDPPYVSHRGGTVVCDQTDMAILDRQSHGREEQD